MTKRGWVLFLAMSVIWGVPYLMIRVAVRDYDPVFVAFARTLLGALLLMPIAVHRRELGAVVRHWKVLLVYTLVEIVGPWVFLGHAETRLTSSTAGLLIAAVPLIAAVILTRLGHDRLDTRRLTGVLVGLAGVAALVGLDVHLDDMVAVGFIGLTALGYAIGPIIINRRLADLPSMGVVTGTLVMAATIYAPFGIWLRPDHFTAKASWSVVGLGVLCTAVAFVIFFALIAEVGPARSTVITYFNPAVALILGVLVLDERLTQGMLIGFPLVIIGSILATSRGRSPQATEPELIAAGSALPACRPEHP